MKYKDWLQKKGGGKSTPQAAAEFYRQTGKDMPGKLAAKVDASDRKQEFAQWRSSQTGKNMQNSNWWSGLKFRESKGLAPTEMQAKARDAYVKKQAAKAGNRRAM